MNTFDKARFQARRMAYSSLRINIVRVLLMLHRRSFTPKFLRFPLYVFATANCVYDEAHMKAYYPDLPEQAFIDVGASLGKYCEYMASRCRRIYAFEPNPILTENLEKQAHALGNIEVHVVALGDSDGTAVFHLHRLPGHGGLINKAPDYTGSSIKVPIRTLDSYDFTVPIGLIKIDTEGYDVNVLRGALETIRKHQPRLIVEIHDPYNENRRAILQILKDLNYHCRYATFPDAPFHTGHIVGDPQ